MFKIEINGYPTAVAVICLIFTGLAPAIGIEGSIFAVVSILAYTGALELHDAIADKLKKAGGINVRTR